VRRAYKLRAHPTRPREGRAVRLLADHCDLYNAALAERREAWRMHNLSVAYGDQSAQLKEIRAADPDGQGRHSFTAQQQTLRRLNQERIVERQRRKQRARPGSGNRRRLRRALAKEWPKLRNRRRDFHHKSARGLVDTCDTIALEQLRLAAMTAAAAGTVEDPGRNVAAKAGLNRSILDAGWTPFTSILVAKAESAGRRVVLVDPGRTSIDCHACGNSCDRPRPDTVVCPVHGELDADLNGARNIATRAGLSSGQASAA
jgi:IS605 OrfB family transposase